MAHDTLSPLERGFLSNPLPGLARIATVSSVGRPHVVPAGWSFDDDADEIVLGGRSVLATARAKHVRSSGVAAVSIDGLGPGAGWSPWAILIRGRARIAESEGAIRLSCDEIVSWGLPHRVDGGAT